MIGLGLIGTMARRLAPAGFDVPRAVIEKHGPDCDPWAIIEALRAVRL